MGKMIAEKILSEKFGTDARAEQIVIASVDYVMVNDVTKPIVFRKYYKLNIGTMYKNRMILIPDHYILAKDIAPAEQAKEMKEFVHAHDLPNYFEIGMSGVCHQLMVEEDFAALGRFIVGADSYTCTYGGFNAFSTDIIGSTEAVVAFVTGKLWFNVPETIKVVVKRKFRKYVGGKDLILRIITDIGVNGANYKVLEFYGDMQNIPVCDRLAISNMIIEVGGKAEIFPCDNLTREYIKDMIRGEYTSVKADPDAEYCRILEYKLDKLEPFVSYHYLPSNDRLVKDADAIIDRVYLGSCTNRKIKDMRIGAEIVKERKVTPGIKFLVVSISQKVCRQIIDESLADIFLDADEFIFGPACDACLGGYMGILVAGEGAVAFTNRNLIRRMSDKTFEVYLAGLAVVAASTIAGRIVTLDQLEGN